MGLINLKTLQPHKVSRDLSGYITYLYGAGGAGKTSFGAQMPSPLLIAFERGYNAIAGITPVDVTSWSEMKQVLRQLDDKEVKGMYKTLIIDTVDRASMMCEKYICSQLGIENIGDGGWATNGWAKVKKEWENTFASIAQKGYAVLFISHAKDKTFKRKDSTEYNMIVPSCSTAYNEIIRNMSDLEGYINIENNIRTLVLRSPDGSIECKSRFKYIDAAIPFSYDSLVEALNKAIDKEGEEKGKELITEDFEMPVAKVEKYDFDAMMAEFKQSVKELMTKDSNKYGIKITSIVECYLGKNKKVTDCTPDQCEQLELVLLDVRELLKEQ